MSGKSALNGQLELLEDHTAFASDDVSVKHAQYLSQKTQIESGREEEAAWAEGERESLTDVHAPRSADVFSSFINLTNTIIGSGVLGLPFAFASTGWALGSVLMVIAGGCTFFALHILSACALHLEGSPTLYSVTEQAMPRWAALVDLAVVVSCFGGATSYLIVIGDLMPQVMSALGASGTLLRRQVWIAIGFGLVAPLSSLRSLDALKYTSIASVLFVFFLTGIIVLFAANVPGLDPCADIDVSAGESCVGTKENLTLTVETGRVFSIFVFAFTCHQNIFGIAAELKEPSLPRMNLVIFWSIAVSFTIYIVVACCGYASYGDHVDSNILVSYPAHALVTVARIFVTLLVAFSYPLQAHPARACIMSLISAWSHEKEEEVPVHTQWIRYIAVTVIFLGLTLAISMSVSDLSVILSFVGATGSTLISFILPGFAYYIIFENEGPAWKRYCALGLGVLGLLIVPVCLTFIFV